jgi:hypothetical protein
MFYNHAIYIKLKKCDLSGENIMYFSLSVKLHSRSYKSYGFCGGDAKNILLYIYI